MPVNPVLGVKVISPVVLLNVRVPFLEPRPEMVSSVEGLRILFGSIAKSLLRVLSVTVFFRKVSDYLYFMSYCVSF